MFGLFSKDKKESLDKGLEKSKQSFFGKLGKALVGKSTVDDEVLDNLEEILVSSDVGVETTLKASLSGSAQTAPAAPAPVQN